MDYYLRDCMKELNMPAQYYPMVNMPQPQLEAMYPKTYNIIQPVVENACDMIADENGQVPTPTQQQLESMIDNVYAAVEPHVEAEVNQGTPEGRQFYGGGRRILRDFVGVLLLNSLIRRRRPFYGYYGYPGYGYPGYGYPGFYGGGLGYGGYPY